MQLKPKIKPRHRHTGLWLIGALAATAFGVLAGAYFLSDRAQTATSDPAIPSGALLASWSANGQDGRHLLRIAEGSDLPAGVTLSGVVVSDTLCQPDAQGFSHCRNGIDLENGMHITVIDTHQMNRYPCLEPGQRLSLSRVSSSWIMAVSL